MLIPTLESRVREVVKDELGHLEKTMNARFEAVDARMIAGFEVVEARLDSLEKRFPMVQEIAEIKARLSHLEQKN